jgi:uncharacterized protein (TIGR03084 family)
VFEDLVAEERVLEDALRSLDDRQAEHESLCPGWTISDVLLHLAQTQEMVVASITGAPAASFDAGDASTVDDLMARWVDAERGASLAELRDRWQKACAAANDAMRNADPNATFTWAATPLKARTLATTRLSEQWIHAHDIADPLGIDYPDTDRLWHIARLAHRTLPYAFMRANAPAPPAVRAELVSPTEEPWVFGPDDAPTRVTGVAGEFCRIAARRLDPDDARSIRAEGERAEEVLAFLRTYA